jgi:hypothetical protein
MAIYKNITRNTTQTLIHSGDRHGSNLSKVSVSNTTTSKAVFDLYLDAGTESFYFIRHCELEKGTSLIFTDCLAFDRNKFTLKIRETDGSADLSVIII